ncbi:MAG TPA: 50S ribosomal protein L18 [Ktedonobacteraceae bacterium]|jgi:large subunit ribosomal protein L18|nr:50S ribosomal protein L18 [Ktedonobacteraceae bacterium]
MIKQFHANQARLRRHLRMRSRLAGSQERPRLNVFRSGHHIYAQVIDDTTGRTLASASTLDEKLRDFKPAKNGKEKKQETPETLAAIADNRKVALAREVGKLIAERAKEQGVSKVVFDRGGYAYHGRVAALATGAREVGLDF